MNCDHLFVISLFPQIAEPVRFVVETKVRIFPATERFWYYTKRTVTRRYRLVVRRMEDGGDGLQLVEVVAGEEVAQPQQVIKPVFCKVHITVHLYSAGKNVCSDLAIGHPDLQLARLGIC